MKRLNVLKLSAVILTTLALGFVGGYIVGGLPLRGLVPFMERTSEWSIGIYTGDYPLNLTPVPGINPVLTGRDVTDVDAKYVADPFLVRTEAGWYMFFEVMERNTQQGSIGLASSQDGLHWSYERIVLDEPFHLSYPQVFEWEGQYYMLPETNQAHSVRLYRAVDFPHSWQLASLLFPGAYVDPTIIRHNELWWIFVKPRGHPESHVNLYFADTLAGPWQLHPQSPIERHTDDIGRKGGRITKAGGNIYKFVQDRYPIYGSRLWAFAIEELTTTSYVERLALTVPVIEASGSGWNADGMHHVDPQLTGDGGWIVAVDGKQRHWRFGLR